MGRSLWKVPFIAPRFFRRNFLSAEYFNTRIRNSTIGIFFVDKTLRVYNGSIFKSFYIRGDMVGMRLGSFSISKVIGSDILLSKDLKSKSKKRKR